MLFEKEDMKRDRDQKRQDVRNGLYRFDAGGAEYGGQQKDQRQKEQPLPARCEERRACGKAERLIELIHKGRIHLLKKLLLMW